MNKLLLCFFSYLVFIEVGQAKIKPEELVGTWKETKRYQPKGEVVDFTDTLFVEFFEDNTSSWGRKTGFFYRSGYTLSEKFLDLGPYRFSFISSSKDFMKLKDEDGRIFELSRYEKTKVQTDNSAATSTTRGPKISLVRAPENLNQCLGKWRSYKRTTDTPMKSINYQRLIRTIHLSKLGDRLSGQVFASEDAPDTPSWTVTKYENGQLYCKGRDERILSIVHCSETELIFEEEGITYFFKQI